MADLGEQPSSRPPLQLLEAHLSEHVQPSVAPVTQAGWLGGGPVPSPQRHREGRLPPRQMVISLVQTAVHSDGGKPHGRVRGDEKYLAVLREDPGLPGALLMVELTAMLACDGRRTCMESQATKSWPWLVQIRNRDF